MNHLLNEEERFRKVPGEKELPSLLEEIKLIVHELLGIKNIPLCYIEYKKLLGRQNRPIFLGMGLGAALVIEGYGNGREVFAGLGALNLLLEYTYLFWKP